MNQDLICINCPRGCHLTVEQNESGALVSIMGNACPRGESYARQEMTDPRRIVTAVIRTNSPNLPFIPVKTDAPFPKAEIPALLNKLYKYSVTVPVKRGDILLQGINGTGINIIATESVL